MKGGLLDLSEFKYVENGSKAWGANPILHFAQGLQYQIRSYQEILLKNSIWKVCQEKEIV